MMELQLPKPIDTYVRAENAGDIDSMANCFVPYATVRDEGHRYEGWPAIRAWKARAQRRSNYKLTPLEITTSAGSATLKALLTGRFPGGPITVDYCFGLVDDQIGSLQIRI